jgi:hypothetical protein
MIYLGIYGELSARSCYCYILILLNLPIISHAYCTGVLLYMILVVANIVYPSHLSAHFMGEMSIFYIFVICIFSLKVDTKLSTSIVLP